MTIKEIITRIQLLRLNILPPYCYDEDEFEKSPEEYADFYRDKFQECLDSVDSYLEAVKKFCEDIESYDRFQVLLHTRHDFISYFPFCYDELDQEAPENRQEYIDWMRLTYQKDCKSSFGVDRLIEYRKLLADLMDHLKQQLKTVR